MRISDRGSLRDLGNPNYAVLSFLIGGCVFSAMQLTGKEIPKEYETTAIVGSAMLGIIASAALQRRNNEISYQGYMKSLAIAGGMLGTAVCFDACRPFFLES